MEFRQAKLEDLPKLKKVYRDIIQNMEDNQISIWDEIYPCEFFQEDIEAECFYVLAEGEDIAGGFALCEKASGEQAMQWQEPEARAMYIDRLGVNVKYLRQGIGSKMLEQAEKLAGEKGAKWLRLFVVDINKPALDLYEKCGFKRAGGIYQERIAPDLVFQEYGLEKLSRPFQES
ncbi:MAG: GNAT family N-acetyltransferase [Blautia sp.]|jgi:ribosomal protein S18 acetylase RimI-like enzyme